MADCALCTFETACSEKRLALRPENPMLVEILSDVFTSENLAFRVASDLILLESVSDERFAEVAKKRLSPREAADIRVTRSLNASMMHSVDLTKWLDHKDSSWFDHALGEDQFTTYFQPIVDATSGRAFAHECLIRLHADRMYNGGEIIEAAVARGRIHVFDSYSRRLAIRCGGKQDAGGKLFINFMPSSIYDPEYCMRSTLEEMSHTSLQPSDIVFEVVESDQIRDVKHLQKICAFYRKHGFGFALDDVGTGSNSLQMMCDLRPDFIKIDKSLVQGAAEPMYASVIRRICDLAGEFGMLVIGEGVENEDMRGLLAELGVGYMQGYHFGRPAPGMTPVGYTLPRPVQLVA